MTLYRRVVGPGRFTLTSVAGEPPVETETDFSCQLTTATIAWSDETEDPISVLCGDEEPGDTTWSATISGTMHQDRRPAGLVRWTWEHKGEVFDSVFVANDADGIQVSGRVKVKPLDIGGDVKTSPTSDFEWEYVGEPVIEDLPVDYEPVNPVTLMAPMSATTTTTEPDGPADEVLV
jgi:hypothetical protein